MLAPLGDHLAAVCNKLLGIVEEKLVLRSARHGDVALDLPHTATLMVLGIGAIAGVLGQTGALDFLDVLKGRDVDAARGRKPSRWNQSR